jgi:hypothetical protein
MNPNSFMAVMEDGEGATPLELMLVGESTQGSLARSATMGFGAQSLWDWADKVAREEHSIRFMGPRHAKIRKRALLEPETPCEGIRGFSRHGFSAGRDARFNGRQDACHYNRELFADVF